MSIRILIADNHGILRQGISVLIEKQDGMEVIGEACDGLIAVQMTHELRPDVVLMDVTMPVLNGVEATQTIKEELPKTRIFALSIHTKREFVLDMIRAGVSGYMVKECILDDLVQAIHAVVENQSYLSPQIASVVLEGITEDSTYDLADNKREYLSPRENMLGRFKAECTEAERSRRENERGDLKRE